MSFLIGLVIGIFFGGGGGFLLAALLAGAARSDAQRPKPVPGRLPGSHHGASSPGAGTPRDGDKAV